MWNKEKEQKVTIKVDSTREDMNYPIYGGHIQLKVSTCRLWERRGLIITVVASINTIDKNTETRWMGVLTRAGFNNRLTQAPTCFDREVKVSEFDDILQVMKNGGMHNA